MNVVDYLTVCTVLQQTKVLLVSFHKPINPLLSSKYGQMTGIITYNFIVLTCKLNLKIL